MSDTLEAQSPQQGKRDRFFGFIGIGRLTPAQIAEQQRKQQQKQARSRFKADVKQAKGDAKDEAKDEKTRILYLARLDKCRLALEALEDKLPVTEKLVTDFKKALADAARLEYAKDYAGAAAKLEQISATHAPEAGRKAWNEAAVKVAKQAPTAFQALTQIDQALADPECRLTREAIAQARRDKIDLGRQLLTPHATETDIAQGTLGLKARLQTLKTQIADAQARWSEVETLRAQTESRLDQIAPISGGTLPLLTDREAAPMRQQLASAATSISVGEFDAAEDVLEPLRDEIDAIELRIGPLRDQWLACVPKLSGLSAKASKFAGEAAAPQFAQEAMALVEKLDHLATQGPGKVLTLADAIVFVGFAEGELEAIDGRQGKWLLFQGLAQGTAQPDPNLPGAKSLEAAKKSVEHRFTEIETALKNLHEAADAKGKGKGKGQKRDVADADWILRRDAARSEWDARVLLARDAATLDEAGMQAKLVALRKEINATRRDPGKLQGSIDAGELASAQAELKLARDAAQAACDALIEADALAGSQEQIALDAISALAGQPGTPAAMIAACRNATQALNAKTPRLKARTARRATDIDAAQQQLGAILDPLPAELAKLKALADNSKTGAKQTPLVKLLDTMQARFDGLKAMKSLTQKSLLEETVIEAEAFAADLAESINAARGESNDDAMSFDKARKTITNLKDGLADGKSRQFRIETHEKLSEAVTALEKGLGTMSMGEMTAKLGELAQQVSDMKDEARLAKARTEQFEKDIVEPLLKTLEAKAFDDAPAYRKTLKARIKGLVGTHSFEDGEATAQKNATDIAAELADVLTGAKDDRGVPAKLAAKQADEVTAENEKIVEQGRWEGESTVVAKQLAALKSLNPREIKPLQDLLDSARTSVDKSKDYTGGRTQLMAIRKRLSLIEANPQGLAITARNKLPQVGARVKRAIGSYMAGLDTVGQAIQGLPLTDLDKAGKDAVTVQLDALRGLFNPASFDEVIAVMSAKGNSHEERSGARERALREVRRMQGYLNNDARLRTLAGSPYNTALPSVLSELSLSLLDIENNMLVSI